MMLPFMIFLSRLIFQPLNNNNFMSQQESLVKSIKAEASSLGFASIGISSAHPVPHTQAYLEWVNTGYHADMEYLNRDDTLAKRLDPHLILENCQSIISLAVPYQRPQTDLSETPDGKGRIAAYAVTHDYHDVLWDKLSQFEEFLVDLLGSEANFKSYVDTGPILERSYSSQAGIGIAGKNTCLLIKGFGSYFFLAEILTDVSLPVDEPYTRDLCGSCRRCIDSCPTGCILPGRQIDAGRCISYLTIENKGIIADNLKPQIGNWFFGCDVCQIVCPHNAWTPEQRLPIGEPILPELFDLAGLFSLSKQEFDQQFKPTALSRAKRHGLLRNAAIVLGNQKAIKAKPVLIQALKRQTDPIILDACQYALAEISK